MTTSSYTSDIDVLLQDSSIIGYFTSTNKSILHFIKTYIEVDKVLCANYTDTNIVYNKLDEIKNAINNQNNHATLLQSKIDTLRETTNNEIRSLFIDLQKVISTHNTTDDLKTVFDNFRERLENINTQRLNDTDRKNLQILTGIQQTFERSLDQHRINTRIECIENVLTNINENFTNNSSKKGQVAETVLFNLLTEAFPDTEVLDTSQTPNSGDIQLVKENKPKILIDSKNFGSKTVPKRDLDKFYNDIQQNNCSGILCNAFGGIANKQHFEIDIVDKNVVVFIHSHQFDSSLFQLATNIIYNMHQELRDKQTDCITLDQRLYQNIKIEYNYYIQTFRHHLDIIRSNVNSLSQLSFTLLDNFFKRKATNVEFKQFTCHICSAQVSTEKILKTHIKKQHSNLIPTTKTPKPTKKQPSEDPVSDIESESESSQASSNPPPQKTQKQQVSQALKPKTTTKQPTISQQPKQQSQQVQQVQQRTPQQTQQTQQVQQRTLPPQQTQQVQQRTLPQQTQQVQQRTLPPQQTQQNLQRTQITPQQQANLNQHYYKKSDDAFTVKF